MSVYHNTAGRLELKVDENGRLNPRFLYGASIKAGDTTLNLSVEELWDLRHLITRSLNAVGGGWSDNRT